MLHCDWLSDSSISTIYGCQCHRGRLREAERGLMGLGGGGAECVPVCQIDGPGSVGCVNYEAQTEEKGKAERLMKLSGDPTCRLCDRFMKSKKKKMGGVSEIA